MICCAHFSGSIPRVVSLTPSTHSYGPCSNARAWYIRSSSESYRSASVKTFAVPFDFEPPALRRIGLAVERVNGVNLAQGLCLLPVPEPVIQGAHAAMLSGHNRYTLAQGVSELREALARRLQGFNRLACSADTLIVTAGSTGAFEIVCEALLAPGDEVVSFIPFYPYHRNTLKRRGAGVRFVELTGDQWSFSAEELDRAITARTKFILLTNPGNPTGKVFSRRELDQIAEIAKRRDVLVVSDEVYEYLTYDGREHISVASLPGMAERTLTMGSYSKTFAITGWRIGYLLPPSTLYDTLKIINDQMFICAPAPLQHGVAHGIKLLPQSFYVEQREKYSRKRAILAEALAAAGLTPVVPQGAYYIVAATTTRYPGRTSGEVAQRMVDQIGVAGVPASDFLGPQVEQDPQRSTFLRFSFSVPDEALEDAARRLRSL